MYLPHRLFTLHYMLDRHFALHYMLDLQYILTSTSTIRILYVLITQYVYINKYITLVYIPCTSVDLERLLAKVMTLHLQGLVAFRDWRKPLKLLPGQAPSLIRTHKWNARIITNVLNRFRFKFSRNKTKRNFTNSNDIEKSKHHKSSTQV